MSLGRPDAGVTYHWFRNGVVIDEADGDTYMGYLEEGDYMVRASQGACENFDSDVLTIEYGEAPEQPIVIAEGPTIWYLACSNDSATNYKWYYEDDIIAGANGYLYVAGQQLGKYAVAVSEEGSCFAKSEPVWIPLGTGVEEDIWKYLRIYPNPTPGLFTVEMNNHVMGDLIIDIYSETGSKIINIKFHKETVRFKTQIDLSTQPSAAYLIDLMIDQYRTNRTVIVQ